MGSSSFPAVLVLDRNHMTHPDEEMGVDKPIHTHLFSLPVALPATVIVEAELGTMIAMRLLLRGASIARYEDSSRG